MDFLTFIDKLTPILVVIIPSYFSLKSTQNTRETEKKIGTLSDKIEDLEKSTSEVAKIGKENNENLTLIGKGLQRLQRFRLQENLNAGSLISTKSKNFHDFTKATSS